MSQKVFLRRSWFIFDKASAIDFSLSDSGITLLIGIELPKSWQVISSVYSSSLMSIEQDLLEMDWTEMVVSNFSGCLKIEI